VARFLRRAQTFERRCRRTDPGFLTSEVGGAARPPHEPSSASDHRLHCELAAAALYSYSWPPPIHSRSAPKEPLPAGAHAPAALTHLTRILPARTAFLEHTDSLPRPATGPTPAAGTPSRRISLITKPVSPFVADFWPHGQFMPGTTRSTSDDQATALQLVRRPSRAASTWTTLPHYGI
jgi:hypothetical protein